MVPQLDRAVALESILRRMGVLVMWLWFIVFHLAISQAVLIAAWYYEAGPQHLAATIAAFYQWSPAATILGIVGILGLSGWVITKFYVRLWRRAYSAATTPFLFRELGGYFSGR